MAWMMAVKVRMAGRMLSYHLAAWEVVAKDRRDGFHVIRARRR
jgi:hypothetical protein